MGGVFIFILLIFLLGGVFFFLGGVFKNAFLLRLLLSFLVLFSFPHLLSPSPFYSSLTLYNSLERERGKFWDLPSPEPLSVQPARPLTGWLLDFIGCQCPAQNSGSCPETPFLMRTVLGVSRSGAKPGFSEGV